MRLDVDLDTMLLFWGEESLILGASGPDGSVVCSVLVGRELASLATT